jgi:hypothetical protein
MRKTMIRKETLTTIDNWEHPTADEVEEMFKLCSNTIQDLGHILGVTAATLVRWKKSGISYADWALLAFLAGKGDIVRPENTEQDIEAKLENLAKVSFIYHKKLSDMQSYNSLSKKLLKNKNNS